MPGSTVPDPARWFNGRMQDENTLEVELEKSQSLNSLFSSSPPRGEGAQHAQQGEPAEELFVKPGRGGTQSMNPTDLLHRLQEHSGQE